MSNVGCSPHPSEDEIDKSSNTNKKDNRPRGQTDHDHHDNEYTFFHWVSCERGFDRDIRSILRNGKYEEGLVDRRWENTSGAYLIFRVKWYTQNEFFPLWT